MNAGELIKAPEQQRLADHCPGTDYLFFMANDWNRGWQR